VKEDLPRRKEDILQVGGVGGGTGTAMSLRQSSMVNLARELRLFGMTSLEVLSFPLQFVFFLLVFCVMSGTNKSKSGEAMSQPFSYASVDAIPQRNNRSYLDVPYVSSSSSTAAAGAPHITKELVLSPLCMCAIPAPLTPVPFSTTPGRSVSSGRKATNRNTATICIVTPTTIAFCEQEVPFRDHCY
jgi:hypothetical protein